MKSMKLKSGEHFWYLTARFSSNRQVKLSASKIILFFHTFLFLLQRAWLFKNYRCEFKSNLKSGEHKFTALLYLKHNISMFCMSFCFSDGKKNALTKGQLISKCLFWCLQFLPKTNENNSTWGIIVI